jgi:hypothetical protein
MSDRAYGMAKARRARISEDLRSGGRPEGSRALVWGGWNHAMDHPRNTRTVGCVLGAPFSERQWVEYGSILNPLAVDTDASVPVIYH